MPSFKSADTTKLCRVKLVNNFVSGQIRLVKQPEKIVIKTSSRRAKVELSMSELVNCRLPLSKPRMSKVGEGRLTNVTAMLLFDRKLPK